MYSCIALMCRVQVQRGSIRARVHTGFDSFKNVYIFKGSICTRTSLFGVNSAVCSGWWTNILYPALMCRVPFLIVFAVAFIHDHCYLLWTQLQVFMYCTLQTCICTYLQILKHSTPLYCTCALYLLLYICTLPFAVHVYSITPCCTGTLYFVLYMQVLPFALCVLSTWHFQCTLNCYVLYMCTLLPHTVDKFLHDGYYCWLALNSTVVRVGSTVFERCHIHLHVTKYEIVFYIYFARFAAWACAVFPLPMVAVLFFGS